MGTEQEIREINEVADRYADYFNKWNADILIGRKGPHFFCVTVKINPLLCRGREYLQIKANPVLK
jgi:hypothetical protein